jgi:hypothetical protein
MSSSKRGGFAMATAILTIPVATAAMMSVGFLCAADCQGTADAATGAQLRQLLLAACVDARSHLSLPDKTASWKTALPADLASYGAKVETAMMTDDNGILFTITATIGKSHATQLLRFARIGDRWTPTWAQLSDPSD